MAKKPSHINPDFRRKASVHYSWEQCIHGLDSGSFPILAYLISKAESKLAEDQQFIRKLLAEKTVKGFVRKIAISGAPGVGKSSFIDSFGSFLLAQGKRIAVLPVDPSSYISMGSILGDKTRMDKISNSENAFIKPMSSSLALGGMAPSSAIACRICERANFDYIIMETVGVGQSEVEARNLVDMFILLLQAGGGDDLQGIKRGIMELADLFIVTKADGALKESAEKTTREINQANRLLLANSYNWHAEVMKHSSEMSSGNEEVLNSINTYFEFMMSNGQLEKLRLLQERNLFDKRSKQMIIDHALLKTGIAKSLKSITEEMESGNISALAALKKLEEELNENS